MQVKWLLRASPATQLSKLGVGIRRSQEVRNNLASRNGRRLVLSLIEELKASIQVFIDIKHGGYIAASAAVVRG